MTAGDRLTDRLPPKTKGREGEKLAWEKMGDNTDKNIYTAPSLWSVGGVGGDEDGGESRWRWRWVGKKRWEGDGGWGRIKDVGGR